MNHKNENTNKLTGLNALHYALKRGSREMVEDIIDALSEPMRLSFICRTGIVLFRYELFILK